MANGKVALAVNDMPNQEKIKKTVSKRLQKKQKAHIRQMIKDQNAPLPTWAMACRNIFMLMVAILVFVMEFFVGGFRYGSMKALETLAYDKKPTRKFLDILFK